MIPTGRLNLRAALTHVRVVAAGRAHGPEHLVELCRRRRSTRAAAGFCRPLAHDDDVVRAAGDHVVVRAVAASAGTNNARVINAAASTAWQQSGGPRQRHWYRAIVGIARSPWRRRWWRHAGEEELEALLEARVPVVLDAVVGPPVEVRGDQGPPAADGGVERADDAVLVRGEAAVPDARAEVVEPPQAAALAAPAQPGLPRQSHPATGGAAVPLDVAPQLRVLLRRPRPALHRRLVAARRSPHY